MTIFICEFMVNALKRFCFPKSKRLVRNSQFKAVLACNRRASDGIVTLFIAENSCGYPRLGVSVGKGCGGAVVRNRLKRLLREAFRQSQYDIPAGFDYLVMVSPQWSSKFGEEPKKAVKRLKLEQVRASLLGLVNTVIKKND